MRTQVKRLMATFPIFLGMTLFSLNLMSGVADRPVPHEVVEDPSTADKANAADNTATNLRDRNTKYGVTPIDQIKGEKSDIDITRAIRRDLTKDDSLSTYAKNVKIITLNAIVTLRGPVRTLEEKNRIAEHALHHTKPGLVINHLEIAPAESR